MLGVSGISNINFKGKNVSCPNNSAFNKLKAETKEFPQDIEYRKNLMKNAGLNPEDYYKLRPIVGAQEIHSIMKAYDKSENFYSVGKNDANIKSGFLRGNLHIHTEASDGALTVQELLDNAAKYADEVVKKQPQFRKEPFTIAITDHDTTDSIKKAIKIIAENPEKYQNLRVILGTEMTTYNDIAKGITKEPTNTHVLAYAIDPNEKTYSDFIKRTKITKLKAEKDMINDANALGKDIFSLQEAKQLSNSLKKNILGLCKHMDAYTESKYVLSEIVCKNEELKEMLKQRNLSSNPDELMKSLCEYSKELYGNNKPLKVLEDFPKFLQNEKSKEILAKEYQNPVHAEYLNKIKQSNSKYYQTFKHTKESNFMPRFEDLYAGLKDQPNAMIGLPHPLKYAMKQSTTANSLKFLDDFYAKFKGACKEKAKFSEVYYQSYGKEIPQELTNFLNYASKLWKLFRTGSADSHGKNIFKRF